jgi:hypothetical protein
VQAGPVVFKTSPEEMETLQRCIRSQICTLSVVVEVALAARESSVDQAVVVVDLDLREVRL